MRFARNPWPLGIVVFFLLFFAGVAAVIVISLRQSDTLVSDNYYEQELKFQDQINAAARAKAAGAAMRLEAGRLAVTIPAEQVKQNLSGQITLYRPSSPELDREIKFQPDEQGGQMVDLSVLAAGPWLVRVRWNAAGRDYYLEQKILLPGK